MHTMKKLLCEFEKNFERYICALFLSVIAISLMIQIFFRYVLLSPLTWPQELVGFLFVWFVYLGASYGVREGAHIRLTHHITILPEKIQRIIRIIADIMWLIFCVVMVIEGVKLVHSMFKFPYISQVFRISKAYIYTIIPIAFGLMGLRILWHIILLVRGKMPPYTFRQEKQLLD